MYAFQVVFGDVILNIGKTWNQTDLMSKIGSILHQSYLGFQMDLEMIFFPDSAHQDLLN